MPARYKAPKERGETTDARLEAEWIKELRRTIKHHVSHGLLRKERIRDNFGRFTYVYQAIKPELWAQELGTESTELDDRLNKLDDRLH
jgi:predicted transcriptional regulator